MAKTRAIDDISRPDLCIIGAGQAGNALAGAALALGLTTVVVEHQSGGGAWVHQGGLASRRFLALARQFRDCGKTAPAPEVWASIRQDLAAFTARLAPEHGVARWRALGLDVIEAPARFSDSHRLEAGGRSIVARCFVLATGAGPQRPKLTGADLIRPLTPSQLLQSETLPERLAIWGGTPLALELAQACGWLGVKVYLVAPGTLFPGIDEEMTLGLRRRLREEGITLSENASIECFEPDGQGLRLCLAGGTQWAADHLLLAGPRAPHVEGLGLDRAGIALKDGAIAVDGSLRTTNRRTFAVGDVTGLISTVAGAQAQAVQVLQQVFLKLRARPAPQAVQIETDPAIVQIGPLPEAILKDRRNARIHRAALADTVLAGAQGETGGHLRAVTAGGRIVAASATGAGAAAFSALLTAAVANATPIEDLGRLSPPQPGHGEALRRLAQQALVSRLQAPSTRLWLRLTRPFR